MTKPSHVSTKPSTRTMEVPGAVLTYDMGKPDEFAAKLREVLAGT